MYAAYAAPDVRAADLAEHFVRVLKLPDVRKRYTHTHTLRMGLKPRAKRRK